MKLKRILMLVCVLTYAYSIFGLPTPPDRPRIWVVSDYSPSTDKDDQVVMNVLLLWANKFRIEGLVPGAHKRNIANSGYNLFLNQHISGYQQEYPNLSSCYTNFPTPAVLESKTYKCSTPGGHKDNINLNNYPSVKAMIEAARAGSASDPLYVLLWGPQGEASTAVKWLLDNEPATLNKMVFIAHASRPANKYNCEQDATACAKLHNWASNGQIKFIECGDSGQKGIHKHSSGPKLSVAVKQTALWIDKKWNNGYPDWSDGASFVCLLPEFNVDFPSLKTNGNDNTGYLTNVYKNNRPAMYTLIEERADAAVNGCVAQNVITASAGAGGSISPSGSVPVPNGGNQTFTITPEVCSVVQDVLVDGSSVGAVETYTFTNVQSDHTIEAFFTDDASSYTVSASSTGCCTITPSGSTVVACGGSLTYTITPDPGCYIVDVIVDGSSVGAVSSYTFNNITGDHNIEAICDEIPPSGITVKSIKTDCNKNGKARNVIFFSVTGSTATPTVNRGSVIADGADWKIKEVNVPYSTTINYIISVGADSKTVPVTSVNSNCQPATTMYTIDASVGGGDGTIAPSGSSSVAEGSDITYSITADDCSSILSVLVDNVDQGPISTYTFANVMADHTIVAIFDDCPPPLIDITITNVVTDCNAGGKARNVIYFTVTGSTATPTVSSGTLLNDGGGAYRLRDVGVTKGSTKTYTITVESVFEDVTVTAVSSCPKSASGLTASFDAEIYPNPSEGIINVVLDNADEAKLQIMNLAGVNVLTDNIKGGLSTIDATKLSRGIYFIQISTNSHLHQQRIIIE